MAKKKLDIEVFSAWNTYAISMMSVLEHCGMWNKEYTFQRFLSVTGIASQFCVDENCSALPITDYDWMEEHARFTERIGVRTKKYYAAPGAEEYSVKQKEAITAIKKSIEDGKACVVWGIDTGEFGVITGYDDEDKVFFSKGIGSRNVNASMPVLYNNLGKTACRFYTIIWGKPLNGPRCCIAKFRKPHKRQIGIKLMWKRFVCMYRG